MKFVKVIAFVMALLTMSTMFVACNEGPVETTPNITPVETTRYTAFVQVKVVDVYGNVVYSTDEGEPYEYDSSFAPYVYTFLEDFQFMNSKHFDYKVTERVVGEDEYGDDILAYTLKSISITEKRKTTTYKSGDVIISGYDGSEQETYWICVINGEEVENMNERIVEDGDVVEFKLAYKDSDKATGLPSTLPPEAEEVPAE